MTASKRPSVVITGGTRGLGFGLGQAFIKLGAAVTLSGRSEQAVEAAASKLKAPAGAEVLGVAGDVARYADCVRLWTSAQQQFGGVDLWINNAGLGGDPVEFSRTPPESLAEVVAVNLSGTLNGARAALEGMRAQGRGQICNVEGFGSAGAKRVGMSVYGATKYAVRYFTRSLVLELQGQPVIVSTLVPGLVATQMLQAQYAAASPRRKKLYQLAADLPETIGDGVAPRLLSNRKNGAVISWVGPLQILGRLLSPRYASRGLLGP